MSYNRRQPRQGVRYGPPRQRERYNENGVIVGRLVGLGILLLTLGILAAGALAFIGDRRPPSAAGSTARSTFAPASSSPSLAILSLPPFSAEPSQSVLPSTPGVTASAQLPSPPASGQPQVQVGAGFVTFGTQADRQLRIVDPGSSFPIDARVVWSAFLTAPADSIELRVQIFKVDGTPPNGERLITDDAVAPVVRGAQIFQRRIRPADTLDGPGIYVVRYVRGTEILSQGSLEITT